MLVCYQLSVFFDQTLSGKNYYLQPWYWVLSNGIQSRILLGYLHPAQLNEAIFRLVK